MPEIELTADERERVRRKVNREVSHFADPAKRARMIRILTKCYTVVALIDAIDREQQQQRER